MQEGVPVPAVSSGGELQAIAAARRDVRRGQTASSPGRWVERKAWRDARRPISPGGATERADVAAAAAPAASSGGGLCAVAAARREVRRGETAPFPSRWVEGKVWSDARWTRRPGSAAERADVAAAAAPAVSSGGELCAVAAARREVHRGEMAPFPIRWVEGKVQSDARRLRRSGRGDVKGRAADMVIAWWRQWWMVGNELSG